MWHLPTGQLYLALKAVLAEKIREMTPGVIRLPFWEMTARNSQVFYVCLNREASSAPEH